MGGRTSSSGMSSGGGVTPTSIPSLTMDNLQAFVDQFGTGMSVREMVSKIYTALPNIGESAMMGGLTGDKGVAVQNERYLVDSKTGDTYQFIRQRSQGTWKVRKIGGEGSPSPAMNTNTKFSSKEINSMGRSQLETVAKVVFVKLNVARGMSAEEATRRAGLLMDGNTDAQLRKFIRKHG